MRRLIIFGIILLGIRANAGDQVNWSKGSVVERNGQVRIGEISFQSVELILFRADDRITVYTPFRIKSFFYYDVESKVNRKFSTLSVEPRSISRFYEIVLWGDVQIVRLAKSRNLIKRRLHDANDFDYYINWHNSFSKLENFKKEVYPLLIENSPVLEEYVQAMKLTPSYLVNVFSIVKLYNKIANNTINVIAMND